MAPGFRRRHRPDRDARELGAGRGVSAGRGRRCEDDEVAIGRGVGPKLDRAVERNHVGVEHQLGLGEGNAYGPVVVAELDPRAGGTVALTVDRVVPAKVFIETDRIKLHQVLRNLVDNAVKFTESGRVVVEAAPGPRDGWLTIAVTDTGPGVPADDLPHIFEPFHQLGPSSTRRTSGVGLGLSIVQRIVTVLGGEIAVSSEIGWGSTFRVTIPSRLPDSARTDRPVPAASSQRAA